jgi:hypothetical protein
LRHDVIEDERAAPRLPSRNVAIASLTISRIDRKTQLSVTVTAVRPSPFARKTR